VLDVTQLALIDAGHQVVPARDGAEAIAVLQSDAPLDILVSDVVLPPGPNGVELARMARRLRPALPILLVSGYAADVLAQHSAHGELELLAKPFAYEELLGRIAKAITTSHGEAASNVSSLAAPTMS
jgi:CheY-like chemotaxis protein